MFTDVVPMWAQIIIFILIGGGAVFYGVLISAFYEWLRDAIKGDTDAYWKGYKAGKRDALKEEEHVDHV